MPSGCDKRAMEVRAMRRREGRRRATRLATLAALGSGRSVRRRVWGSGCEGWRNILGHDGVLEAVPILLGAAIDHATVLRERPRVTGTAIGHAAVLGALPVHAVHSCVLLVRHVLLCVLIGRESVGTLRRRIRRHFPCRRERQRGVERVERGSQACDGGGLLGDRLNQRGYGALHGVVDERVQARGDVLHDGRGVRPRRKVRRVGDAGALRGEGRGSGGGRGICIRLTLRGRAQGGVDRYWASFCGG